MRFLSSRDAESPCDQEELFQHHIDYDEIINDELLALTESLEPPSPSSQSPSESLFSEDDVDRSKSYSFNTTDVELTPDLALNTNFIDLSDIEDDHCQFSSLSMSQKSDTSLSASRTDSSRIPPPDPISQVPLHRQHFFHEKSSHLRWERAKTTPLNDSLASPRLSTLNRSKYLKNLNLGSPKTSSSTTPSSPRTPPSAQPLANTSSPKLKPSTPRPTPLSNLPPQSTDDYLYTKPPVGNCKLPLLPSVRSLVEMHCHSPKVSQSKSSEGDQHLLPSSVLTLSPSYRTVQQTVDIERQRAKQKVFSTKLTTEMKFSSIKSHGFGSSAVSLLERRRRELAGGFD
ncbi:hypothetical protein GEMRC1_002158 [Eukaryota sp. GEM-RC1]